MVLKAVCRRVSPEPSEVALGGDAEEGAEQGRVQAFCISDRSPSALLCLLPFPLSPPEKRILDPPTPNPRYPQERSDMQTLSQGEPRNLHLS